MAGVVPSPHHNEVVSIFQDFFLDDAAAVADFEKYLLSEHSEENLHFIVAVRAFQKAFIGKAATKDMRRAARAIFNAHFASDAPEQIAMPHTEYTELRALVNAKQFSAEMFQACYKVATVLVVSHPLKIATQNGPIAAHWRRACDRFCATEHRSPTQGCTST